jgi:iron complex transport system substrate-binding protein
VRRSRRGLLAAGLLVLLGACAPDGDRPGPAPGAEPGTARRIIALSPHLVELSFAAGAGDRLVGVVEFSNEPPAARQLPRIGDAFRLDYEAIATLEPDLVLGWPSGNSPATLERLERLGYRVLALEPASLEDIGRHIRLIGRMAGTGEVADAAAGAFDARLQALREAHRNAVPVRVFYQISPEPLITVSGGHFVSEVLELCGARNVFGHLQGWAVTVGREDVLAADPDVIVANEFTPGTPGIAGRSPLDEWHRWTGLGAVNRGLLYLADPDLLGVPGPRLLDGAEGLCRDLDDARRRLAEAGGSG